MSVKTIKFCLEDSSGGILVGEPIILKELDEELLFSMSIAVDFEGTTELVYDYPDEDWPTVWQRETEPVMKMCNAGEIAFAATHEGIIFVKVVVGELESPDESRILDSQQAFLNVQGDKIAVVEAGSFLVTKFSQKELDESDFVAVVEVVKGSYLVNFLTLAVPTQTSLERDQNGNLRKVYGTEDLPAILVQLIHTSAHSLITQNNDSLPTLRSRGYKP